MPSDLQLLAEQTGLIAAREYRERVRSRAFVLTTILTPALMAVLFGGSFLLAAHSAGGKRIAIAADDVSLAHNVAAQLRADKESPTVVEADGPATPSLQAALNRRVDAKELSGYLLLQPEANGDGTRAVYVSGSSTDMLTSEALAAALGRAETRHALLAQGMPSAAADRVLRETHVQTEHLHEGRIVAGSNAQGFVGAYSLVFLLYIVVLIYGMNVARSVVQEKTSRIYEVLLATARADALMAGKLLGVGAAGLTQVAIWFVLLAVIAGSSLAASYGLHGLGSLGIAPVQIAFFAIYFTLGFLFYSGISAGIGALLGAEQELQQFSFVIVMPLLVSMLMMQYVLTNPSAPLSVWMSLIPPFTPIVMYLRVCAQQPPIWQLALSIVLMLLSIVAVVWLAARIYRIGILMYGKRPTLPEALRWLRQS